MPISLIYFLHLLRRWFSATMVSTPSPIYRREERNHSSTVIHRWLLQVFAESYDCRVLTTSHKPPEQLWWKTIAHENVLAPLFVSNVIQRFHFASMTCRLCGSRKCSNTRVIFIIYRVCITSVKSRFDRGTRSTNGRNSHLFVDNFLRFLVVYNFIGQHNWLRGHHGVQHNYFSVVPALELAVMSTPVFYATLYQYNWSLGALSTSIVTIVSWWRPSQRLYPHRSHMLTNLHFKSMIFLRASVW